MAFNKLNVRRVKFFKHMTKFFDKFNTEANTVIYVQPTEDILVNTPQKFEKTKENPDPINLGRDKDFFVPKGSIGDTITPARKKLCKSVSTTGNGSTGSNGFLNSEHDCFKYVDEKGVRFIVKFVDDNDKNKKMPSVPEAVICNLRILKNGEIEITVQRNDVLSSFLAEGGIDFGRLFNDGPAPGFSSPQLLKMVCKLLIKIVIPMLIPAGISDV